MYLSNMRKKQIILNKESINNKIQRIAFAIIEDAEKSLVIFQNAILTWCEEPFFSDAFYEYSELYKKTNLPLAGGESCHSIESAKNMIRFGKVKFIQIDAGIAGGILAGKEICDFAESNKTLK